MPYTMEDFRREYTKEIEEEHRKLAEELLKITPPEELLKGLSTEERLKGLPVEEIERYLRRLKAHPPSGEQSASPD